MTERTDPERELLQASLQGDVAAETELARALADLVWVDAVHKLAQRVKKTLREEIGETDTIKRWRLSV